MRAKALVPGEGKMHGVVNALAPQQGQDGVLRSPMLCTVPSTCPSYPEHNDCVTVWWWVGGWGVRVGAALRIRPNLGEAGEAELRGLDFALSLIDSSAL